MAILVKTKDFELPEGAEVWVRSQHPPADAMNRRLAKKINGHQKRTPKDLKMVIHHADGNSTIYSQTAYPRTAASILATSISAFPSWR